MALAYEHTEEVFSLMHYNVQIVEQAVVIYLNVSKSG